MSRNFEPFSRGHEQNCYRFFWLELTISASLRAAVATKLLMVILCFFAALTMFVASSSE
jgi:hypothetical protein